MSQSNPWWKEPWPWLLMSGPLLAMAGCAVTIWVAMQHADRPIVDGVVRQGFVVRETVAATATPPAVRPAGAQAQAQAVRP